MEVPQWGESLQEGSEFFTSLAPQEWGIIGAGTWE